MKGLAMGRGLKTIVSLRVNSATMEMHNSIAAMGASAYCRKMESISVHHSSLKTQTVMEEGTAAAICFVSSIFSFIVGVYHVSVCILQAAMKMPTAAVLIYIVLRTDV